MARKSSFSKKLNKTLSTIKSDTVRVGFDTKEPKWISFGNFAANRIFSGMYDKAMCTGRNYVLYGESGCHAAGSKVIMFDGSIKNVEDVVCGDQLLGPDSTPRNVLTLFRGKEMMYNIIDTINNIRMCVNGSHVLTLYDMNTDELYDTTVSDYLESGNNSYLVSSKAVNFKNSKHVNLYYNLDLVTPEKLVSMDIESRSDLLIWIIDTYGKTNDDCVIIGDSVLEKFDDIKFLVQSLGHDVVIGDNTMVIFIHEDTLLTATGIPKSYSGHNYYPFTIEEAKEDYYFGFELDGDHRYLMDDFTITHNSGKSYLAAKACADFQQQHDGFVLWLDSEAATDSELGKTFLENAGVSLDEDNFMYLGVSSIEDVKKIITKSCKDFREDQESLQEGDEMQPLLIIIDSYGALLTESETERTFKTGEMRADMGQIAKTLGSMISSATHLCAGLDVMICGISHTFKSQDQYATRDHTAGGSKMVYYSSGSIIMNKKEMRLEDMEDVSLAEEIKKSQKGMTADALKQMRGDKQTVGITTTIEVLKTRMTRAFAKIKMQISREKGIDPYSGLFILMQQEGVITSPSSGWYAYVDENNEEVKFRKNQFYDHAQTIIDLTTKREKEEGILPNEVVNEEVEMGDE